MHKPNICKRLFASQLTGHGMKRIDEIPLPVLALPISFVNGQHIETLNSTMALLQEISANALRGCYQSFTKQKIKDLFDIIHKPADCIFYVHYLGMVELLLNIMLKELFHVNEINPEDKLIMKCPRKDLEECSYILHIVANALMENRTSFHHLRWNYKLVEALFSLEVEEHFINNHATNILDSVLLGTSHLPIALQDVHGLDGLIVGLQARQTEGQFFHTLSTFLSDSEYIASCHFTLEKHDHLMAQEAVKIINMNQDFLLRLPGFLEKMSSAACLPGAASASQPLINDMMQMLHLFSSGHYYPHDEFGGDIISQIIEHKQTVFRADLYHVISLLLLGKQRDEVQQRLSKTSFFSDLYLAAEKILWKDFNGDATIASISGGNDYSAAIFTQIQFLRLIHSIADNHPNRYYLLSQSELDQLKAVAIARNLDLPPELVDFRHDGAYSGSRGVMSLIVDKLKTEPADSLIRFWITRALEAFLRGETSKVHQMFLLNKNLVEDTIHVLLLPDAKHDMVIQGSFDFLSTIMRNNIEGFRRCEAAIDCTAKFSQLIREIRENLVDSNMFLRCIVLTNENLKKIDPIHAGYIRQNRLLNQFSSMEALLEVLSSIVRILTVPTVSQENVSCLNTVLLICLFAHREDKLPSYLSSLTRLADAQSLLENLKSLVQFWKIHYTLPHKKTDRANLELSSGVKFEEWLHVVEQLIDADASSPVSIACYVREVSETRLKTLPFLNDLRTL